MIDYTLVLRVNFPDAEWTLNGEEYEGLTWLSSTDKPTKQELDALWDSTIADVESIKQAQADAKAALLERLGITQDEAKLLLA